MKDEWKQFQDMPIPEVVKQLRALKDTKDGVDEQAKLLQSTIDHLELSVLPEKMAEEGIENIRVTGAGRLHVRADLRVSTKGGLRDALIEWFETNGLEDLVTETVNASTLKAWVKEAQRKGLPVPEDFINISPYERAILTKE